MAILGICSFFNDLEVGFEDLVSVFKDHIYLFKYP